MELDRIRLLYTPQEGVDWDFSADEGRIPPDGRMVQFFGRVLALAGDEVQDGDPARIRTDYLEVDPDTLIASTDSKVFIDYDGQEINGTGMRLYLEEDRLELLSNVNGTFVP